MNAVREYVGLGLGALFLREDAYATMREESQPIVKGLIFVVLVAVVVALAAFVGTVLEWSTTPNLSNLKNIVLEEMQRTQWFQAMMRSPQGRQSFQQGYDLWWQVFGGMFGVDLIGAVLGIVFNPVGLVLRWLIYGVFAFLFARLLGGVGTLGQVLGSTALAVAPEMLRVLQLLPYVELGGLTIWGLVCTYVGIKTSTQLSPWRAFWATLLPPVLLLFGLFLFSCLIAGLVSTLIAGGGR